MTDRRAFLFALAAVSSPLASQASRLPRIGYLLVQPVVEPPSRERQAFLDGLAELGYVPGRSVEMVYASAQNEPDFLDDVARDLLRHAPDVICVSGAVALVAAKRATATVPIVVLAVGDPVGIGAVRSLARPEGNVTGVSFLSSDLAGKRVQLIADLLPKARRVAVLWDTRNANARAEAAATLAAIRRLGLADVPFTLASETEVPRALERIGNARPDALYVVFEGNTVAVHRTAIADLGIHRRLPIVSGWGFLTEAGGLISYAPDLPALFRRGAHYVQRILKGASPRELPFEQASTVELVVNLRTAQAIGVALPQALLLRADRVLQ